MVGFAVLVLGGANTALLTAASRLESAGLVYPYKWQDWLRYLLPTLWHEGGPPRLLLTGPSTVREGFTPEALDSALPGTRAFAGAVSLGTLAGVMTTLEYVERSYGAGALPRIVVLGVSPRFLAEIPRERPFPEGLERYSPKWHIPGEYPTGFGLVAKPRWRGVLDHASFLLHKQEPRYRAVAAHAFARLFSPGVSARIRESAPARAIVSSGLLSDTWLARALARGPREYAAWAASPYRYRGNEPMTDAELTAQLDDERSWWHEVYRWSPARDVGVVKERVADLLAYAARHHMEVYVVDLPDRLLSRQRYLPGLTAQYQALLEEAFADTHVLRLRCLLAEDEFLDAEHATEAGATRMTAALVEFITAVREHRDADAARLANAHACPPA